MDEKGHPVLRHHSEFFAVKDEDAVFWQQTFPKDAQSSDPEWSIFCLCDGHNGDESVKFLEERLIDTLLDNLPSETTTDYASSEGQRFSVAIAKAIVETFETLDQEWLLKKKLSGSTVTIAVLHGWFLTVANVGDSLAYLHCDGCIYQMTHDHRLCKSQSEQDRLKKQGVTVAALNEYGEKAESGEAAFGPLRAWPGGLAMGRSFGDLDVHPAVISSPHIKQIGMGFRMSVCEMQISTVELQQYLSTIEIPPHAGARLVMASDGVWDHLSGKVAMKAVKKTTVAAGCTKVLNLVQRVGGFDDDTTVFALDIVSRDNAHLKAPVHPKISKKAKMVDMVRSVRGKSKKRRKIPMPFFLSIDGLDLDQVSSINDSAHGQTLAKRKMAEYMHNKLSTDSAFSLSSESNEECQ